MERVVERIKSEKTRSTYDAGDDKGDAASDVMGGVLQSES